MSSDSVSVGLDNCVALGHRGEEFKAGVPNDTKMRLSAP